MHLNHKHILVTARGLKNPPTDPEQIKNWLTRLVEAVNMKVLLGPYATYCDAPDNEGVTGIVCLVTSHASIHVWHKAADPFLKLDLYSCDDFETATVTTILAEFEPSSTEYMVIDRNNNAKILETGVIEHKPVTAVLPKHASALKCSFCGLPANQTEILVMALGDEVGICKRCVEVSQNEITKAISKRHSK